MKKLTALILTAVMLVCMTAIVPVSAAGEKITVVPGTGNPVEASIGDEITISWKTTENTGFYSLLFHIDYDAEAFTWKAKKNAITGKVSYAAGTSYKLFDGDADMAGLITENVAPAIDRDGRSTYLLTTDGSFDMPHVDGYNLISQTFVVNENVPTGDYTFNFVFGSADNIINISDVQLATNDVESVTVHINGVDPEIEGPTVVDGLKSKGGQVRVPHNGQEPDKFGFRFVSSMDSTVGGVEYGTLVIPTDLLEGELVVGNVNAADVVANKVMSNEDGVVTFNATMIDIKDANLEREFTTRAYAKLADGSYVYGTAYKTTIFAVADELVNDANADQAHKDYIKTHVHGKLGK